MGSTSGEDEQPLFDADALRQAAAPATIGGRTVEIGDGILVNDDASGAWWRASVQDVRPGQVFVHYTGCDPAWDEWMDAESPKICLMDAVEQKKDDAAFQSDTIEDGIDDEALLEQYRKQRWDDNARWQLNTFAQAQLGKWEGQVELYTADAEGRLSPVDDLASVACSCEARVCASNTISVEETLPPALEPLRISAELGLGAFRPEVGNMAVACAYSFCQQGGDGAAAGGGSDELLFELAMGEEERRVRCKFLYRCVAEGEAAEGEEAAARAMRIDRVAIVREVRGGGDFIDGNAGSADLDGTPGRGLYDPPPGEKSGYITLYLEGGMTIAFPTRQAVGAAGVVSMDWIAGKMRYQIDRKWRQFDGSLASLELTEIQKADAEVVPPDFPHQSGGQSQ